MAGLLDPEDEAYLASLQRRQAPAARPIRARNLDGLLAPDAGPSGVAPWSGLPPTPGYTEARVAAPLRADDLQGFLGQTRDVLRGTPAASGYEPSRVTQLVADSLAGPAGTVGGARGIRAFHGSPHDFDRFRMDRIGTGEGAQAYGHGLYFAENEGVARGYRDKLAGRLNPQEARGIDQAWVDAAQSMWRTQTPEEIRSILRSAYRDPAPTDAQLDLVMRAANPGRVYEVNLLTDPDRLIDWYSPLRMQPAPVQEAFRSLGARVDQERPIYDAINRSRTNEYFAGDLIGADRATPAEVSSRLRDAGISGLSYLDRNSRGAGAGSRNYVMFDDALIEILRKYGIVPGMVGGGGAAGLLGGAEGASEQ